MGSRMNNPLIEHLKAQREKVRYEMAQLQGHLNAIDDALRVSAGGNTAESPSNVMPNGRRTRGSVKDTVLGLVQEYAASGVSAFEVVEKARAKGVSLDRGSVSSLLSKLKSAGTLDLRDGNRYVPAKPTVVLVERHPVEQRAA